MKRESTFSFGWVHPGEADILATVVENLNDDTAKLVYADWLEERNDSGGPFLRKFVKAVQTGNELPDPSELGLESVRHDTRWRDMIGYQLVSLIRSLELEEHTSAILRLAKPAVAIETSECTERELRVDATKFGGLPRLPKGMDWPQWEEVPLEFLAQLNLAEVRATIAGRAFPTDGLLSFFMYHNYPDDEYGEGRRNNRPGGLQIIYSPPDADLWPVPVPDDLTDDLGVPHTPHSLHFTDFLDLPCEELAWRVSPPVVVMDRIRALRAEHSRPDHQLFGYTQITVLCDDPTPGPEWEQLIGFSSDRNLKWGWGDGHRLFWYIRSADLREMRFDRTKAIDG